MCSKQTTCCRNSYSRHTGVNGCIEMCWCRCSLAASCQTDGKSHPSLTWAWFFTGPLEVRLCLSSLMSRCVLLILSLCFAEVAVGSWPFRGHECRTHKEEYESYLVLKVLHVCLSVCLSSFTHPRVFPNPYYVPICYMSSSFPWDHNMLYLDCFLWTDTL